MSDDDDIQPQRSLWREILGTLIGSIPLALAVLVWGVSIETRFTRHDTKIEILEKSEEAMDRKAQSIEGNVTRRLDRIEDKLDRAIANQSRQSLQTPGIWRDDQRTGPR